MNEKNIDVNQETAQKEKKSSVYLPNEGEDFKQFQFGDCVFSCKSCEQTTEIAHPSFLNVEVGIQLPVLYTNNQQVFALSCSYCGKEGIKKVTDEVGLTMHMIEAKTPPAHNFSKEGFDMPNEVELTWEAGKEVLKYEVLIKNLDKPLAEGEENEFILLGEVTEPKFILTLEDATSYEVIVNSFYNRFGRELSFSNNPLFLSTQANPEAKESADEPQPENSQPEEVKEGK